MRETEIRARIFAIKQKLKEHLPFFLNFISSTDIQNSFEHFENAKKKLFIKYPIREELAKRRHLLIWMQSEWNSCFFSVLLRFFTLHRDRVRKKMNAAT